MLSSKVVSNFWFVYKGWTWSFKSKSFVFLSGTVWQHRNYTKQPRVLHSHIATNLKRIFEWRNCNRWITAERPIQHNVDENIVIRFKIRVSTDHLPTTKMLSRQWWYVELFGKAWTTYHKKGEISFVGWKTGRQQWKPKCSENCTAYAISTVGWQTKPFRWYRRWRMDEREQINFAAD